MFGRSSEGFNGGNNSLYGNVSFIIQGTNTNPGILSFGGGVGNTCTYNTRVDDGLWHHIAGVVDRTNNIVSFYIDGDLKDQNTFTSVSLEPFNNNHFVLSGGIQRIIAATRYAPLSNAIIPAIIDKTPAARTSVTISSNATHDAFDVEIPFFTM